MSGNTIKATMPYRPEIDGLRAIAILVVLLFHCGIPGFGGGFVGVDVFFVISGFLISSIVLADLKSGRFSFRHFYIRRVRRLLPALLVAVLLTLATSLIVMTPEHVADAAKSGALSISSLSNFYFAQTGNYFDSSATSKPFLHMWSLSVEEQFYLFWPATLFLLYRWKRSWGLPALVLIGIPVGLYLSEYWIGVNAKQAYFLLPFRAFQFLIGAACIWLQAIQIRNPLLKQVIVASGVALILYSSIAFSETTPFPGMAALTPSIGAALVIWNGQGHGAHEVLASRPMTWFGRISYSTYLLHWPIVVFWSYLAINAPSLIEKLGMFLLSVVAGQILHSQVEQRFRQTKGAAQHLSLRYTMSMAGVTLTLAVLCYILIATRGLPGRMALVPDVNRYRDQSTFPFLRDYGDGALQVTSGGERRVLFFGDSMMQNYVPAILRLDGMHDAQIDIVSRGGCVLAIDAVLVNNGSPDRECLQLRDQLYQANTTYDLVVWSQNWLGYGSTLHWHTDTEGDKPAFSGTATFDGWHRGVSKTLQYFGLRAKKLVFIGPPIEVANVNPVLARIGPLTNIAAIPAQFDLMKELASENRDTIGSGFRELVNELPNALYIDPRSLLCSGQACHFSNGIYSYYLDGLHNTTAATPILESGLKKAGVRLELAEGN